MGKSLALCLLCTAALVALSACSKSDTSCTFDSPNCGSGKICVPDDGGGGVCENPCDPTVLAPCKAGKVCDRRTDDQYGCYAPVVLNGTLIDATTGAAIVGGLVTIIDESGAPVSDTVASGIDGSYSLAVPVVRNPNGTIASGMVTIRAFAAGYVPFPHGIRPAIPIDMTSADASLVVQNTATTVALIPLPAGDRVTISGRIVATSDATLAAGVLVVAEGANGSTFPAYGFSDKAGNFTVFNVPDGSWQITGYRIGLQLTPVPVSVSGSTLTDLSLIESSTPLTTVSGTVNIVNAPGGSMTSVVLVPKSLFNGVFENGPVPLGLRAPAPPTAPNVNGAFSIANVPDGVYLVLAAFENDNLVRDPDPNIAGTQIPEITVSGQSSTTLQVGTSFKITAALAVSSPGKDGPEKIDTPTPTFVWADDSSEDGYQLVIYDALGNEIWRKDDIPKVSGSATVSQTYAGPALTPGMFYQFRVASIKSNAPISRTEGLRGVFYLELPAK